jgi:Phosphotransferase enzyme family
VGAEIDLGKVADWCHRHLGSEPTETLFTRGNLSKVLGLRLVDGREVVVKIRPAEARLAGCTAVQRHLWHAGFPCPEPLAGPTPLDGTSFAVNAETLVLDGSPYPPGDGPDRARAFAELLARLITLAPRPDQVPDLAPSPAWINWDHAFAGLWPPPDDRDADLNNQPETDWLDRFGQAARGRLATTRTTTPVIGHCDWESHNLDFRDGRPWAVHDWDSVVTAAETVIVGVAAAMWPAGIGCAGATLKQGEDFVEAYQKARGRQFSDDELQETWAAGLWIRSFNAKKFILDGFDTLTPAEAEERLRRAVGSIAER